MANDDRNEELSPKEDGSEPSELRVTEGGAEQATRPATPDVVLQVPSVRVKSIDLDVDELKARVSLHAEMAGLVTLDAGIDVSLGDTELHLQEVDAQALLEVSLREVYRIAERSLTSVDRNPQIMEKRLEQQQASFPQQMGDGGERRELPQGEEHHEEHHEEQEGEQPHAEAEAAAPESPREAPEGEEHEPERAAPSERRARGRALVRVFSRAVSTPRTVLRSARKVAGAIRHGAGR